MPTLSPIDLILVATGIIFNLLVIGLFIARTARDRRAEWVIGLAVSSLAIPCAAGAAANLASGREWWTIVFPLLLLLYSLLEFGLDYLWKVPFRTTRILPAYLVVFYASALAMVGYAFGVGKGYGFVALGTYLCGLAAAWHSYTRVGHG
jgi:hypothetical protein